MSQEIQLPLADIIKRMSSVPVQGEAARLKRRFTDATGGTVVLCDVSGSMEEHIGSAGMSKFEHLQFALEDVMAGNPKIILVAFGDAAKQVKSAKDMPEPGTTLGCSTNLGGALESIAKVKPRKTIIISDGLPNDEQHAMDAAEALTGQIDCIYCGPEGHPAVGFLRSLSKLAGGVQVTWDGYKPIGTAIRGLLGPG